MSSKYPLYSIILIHNYKYEPDFMVIVLDRGGAITGNKIDILVENEAKSSQLGIQKNVEFEVLRWGK